jgi:hypothetical protein
MIPYTNSYYNTAFCPLPHIQEYASGTKNVSILRCKGAEAPTKFHQTVRALFKQRAATSRDVRWWFVDCCMAWQFPPPFQSSHYLQSSYTV